MQSEVLAPKWIFRYLQVLGIHSSFNGRMQFNICYQFVLLILVMCNCANVIYEAYFYYAGKMQITLQIVSTLEGETKKKFY